MSTPPTAPNRNTGPDQRNAASSPAIGAEAAAATPAADAAAARRKKLNLVALILAMAIVSLLLRLVYASHTETTSLMFVGIPAILAILVTLTPPAKHPIVMAIKGVTLGLLMSAIFFGEGVVCILMMAPIAYIVAIVVAAVVSSTRAKGPKVMCVALLPFVLMSLEGATDNLSFPRRQSVQVEQLIAATPSEVEATLAAPMSFHTRRPVFLRMGFPRPVFTRGQGLDPGSERVIHFAGGEGNPGDLTLRVESSEPGSVKFVALEDHSKIEHWLKWKTSEVQWHAVDATHTSITWTLTYDRSLDPAWYFAPWEHYGTSLAASYLIENLATPSPQPQYLAH